nr:MAG TPA: hypothetical protein [Bacteriophage sp.]
MFLFNFLIINIFSQLIKFCCRKTGTTCWAFIL